MSTEPASTTVSNASPRRSAWPLFGLTLLSLGSFFAYPKMLVVPSIRSTAWPVFAVMGAVAILSIWMVRQRPRWSARILAGVNVALPLLFAGAFFGLLALPRVASKVGAQAPEFTLQDQEQRPVGLAATLAQGPVLLVFYRGHW